MIMATAAVQVLCRDSVDKGLLVLILNRYLPTHRHKKRATVDDPSDTFNPLWCGKLRAGNGLVENAEGGNRTHTPEGTRV